MLLHLQTSVVVIVGLLAACRSKSQDPQATQTASQLQSTVASASANVSVNVNVNANANANEDEGGAEPSESSVSEKELQLAWQTAYLAKDWRGCEDALSRVAKRRPLNASEAYNGACCRALRGDMDGAFEWLGIATDKGYREAQHMQRDADLLSLHKDPRWLPIKERVEATFEIYLATINRELLEIYQADQEDRTGGMDHIDWEEVSSRDEARRQRVQAIVDAGEAKAGADWFHAAMVMQHGNNLESYQKAHDWALKASELSPELASARWLAAAAKDRWLMNQGKPQWYGTQFKKTGDTWELYTVDDSVSDEERENWNVPRLEDAKKRLAAMNEH